MYHETGSLLSFERNSCSIHFDFQVVKIWKETFERVEVYPFCSEVNFGLSDAFTNADKLNSVIVGAGPGTFRIVPVSVFISIFSSFGIRCS